MNDDFGDAVDWQHYLEYTATDMADIVEDAIRNIHPEVDHLAIHECEGNTLLYGDDFDPPVLGALVDKITTSMSIDAHAVIYTSYHMIVETQIFPTMELAEAYKLALFNKLAREEGWNTTDSSRVDYMDIDILDSLDYGKISDIGCHDITIQIVDCHINMGMNPITQIGG